MKKLILLSVLVLGLLAVAAAPSALAAVGCPLPPCGSDVSPTTGPAFTDLIQTIFNVVFGILVIVAAFFLLFAAFEYITAQGEQEKIHKAKNTIVYAIVALVVAILAWGLPRVVLSFFGVH